jgi:uncharacterized membrane protein
MDMQTLDALVPRLLYIEGYLAKVRHDLKLATELAREEENPAPFEPAPEPQPKAELAYTEPSTGPMRPAWPSFEQLLGGKALHLAGLLLVFLGTGFFLKVAFDHNWIAPPERVVLGLIVGAGVIAYAQFLAKRGARYFSDGITALGAAIEFLSLYAAGPFFHLISPAEVFVGMVVVSGALVALAWRHRSERLGVLGAIAGFLSPLLIGAPQSNEWMLASYLVVFATSLLVLGELLESKILAPLALAGTLFYGIGHFYGARISPIECVEILGMLYATFAVAGWIVARRHPNIDPVRSAVACVALGTFILALFGLLSDHERSLLATILFALAAAHVGAAALLRSRYQGWLATAALTLAIPVEFHGAALATGWAVEAVALVGIGLLLKDEVLRVGGLALLGVGLLRDVLFDATFVANAPLWNERFVSLSVLVAATLGANASLALKPLRTEADAMLSAFLRVASHAIALWMLTAETWDYASSAALHAFGTQGANVAVSILWTLFATILIGAGLRKREAMLRWEGLCLIVAATAKVLIFDLSSLDLIYRVLSGLVVGIVLIGVSYAYQRRTALT